MNGDETQGSDAQGNIHTVEMVNGGCGVMLMDRKTVAEFYSALVAADVKGVAETVVFQLLGILSKSP